MVVTETYTGAPVNVMPTDSYLGLASIILTVVGIILFATGLALKKKVLWIIGLIIALICGLSFLWMRSLGP